MTGALVYLTWHTVLNRLRRQATRLRSPRYALALLLGLGWVTAVLWQRWEPGAPHPSGPWVEVVAALSILLLIGWSWLSSPDARALTFSPAEVTLLFPAPISRLTLLHYKLLQTQLVILVNVVIWTALASRQQPGLPVGLRALGFWVLITTLALHRLAARDPDVHRVLVSVRYLARPSSALNERTLKERVLAEMQGAGPQAEVELARVAA